VLNNLIHNAIKFTDSGFVLVRVGVLGNAPGLRGEVAKPSIFIEIADSGIGIPKAQHTTVFEKFVQVDGSDHRAHQGSGLGLALVKELVTLMGGNITLDSTPSKGSTFTVLLPLEPLHSQLVAASLS
jgi:signal transduction histidine kinase